MICGLSGVPKPSVSDEAPRSNNRVLKTLVEKLELANLFAVRRTSCTKWRGGTYVTGGSENPSRRAERVASPREQVTAGDDGYAMAMHFWRPRKDWEVHRSNRWQGARRGRVSLCFPWTTLGRVEHIARAFARCCIIVGACAIGASARSLVL